MMRPSIPRYVETCKPPESTTSGIDNLFHNYHPIMGRPRKAEASATRDPFAVEIGRRIRAAREYRRWSASELARKVDWDVRRLNNYEMGERMPGPEEVLRLAALLGEAPAYLMNLAHEREPARTRSRDEEILLELYRGANTGVRQRAIDILNAAAVVKREGLDLRVETLKRKKEA